MSSPGWATVGRTASGESRFTLSIALSLCQMCEHVPDMNRPQFLDEAAVRSLLKLEDLIPTMERALADFSTAKVVQPVRSIVSVTEHRGFMGLMPGVYGDVMGAKLVNLYPDNAQRGLPTHLGVIVLFRAETGEPLAVMDGRLITELRTA